MNGVGGLEALWMAWYIDCERKLCKLIGPSIRPCAPSRPHVLTEMNTAMHMTWTKLTTILAAVKILQNSNPSLKAVFKKDHCEILISQKITSLSPMMYKYERRTFKAITRTLLCKCISKHFNSITCTSKLISLQTTIKCSMH